MKVTELLSENFTYFKGKCSGGSKEYLKLIGGTQADVDAAKAQFYNSSTFRDIKNHPDFVYNSDTKFGTIELVFRAKVALHGSNRTMRSANSTVDTTRHWYIAPSSQLNAINGNSCASIKAEVTLKEPPFMEVSPDPVKTILDNYMRSAQLVLTKMEKFSSEQTKIVKGRADRSTPKSCREAFSDLQRKNGVRAKIVKFTDDNIVSLDGCPTLFKGNLDISNRQCNWTNLVGGPQIVEGMFGYSTAKGAISAKGCPIHVGGLIVNMGITDDFEYLVNKPMNQIWAVDTVNTFDNTDLAEWEAALTEDVMLFRCTSYNANRLPKFIAPQDCAIAIGALIKDTLDLRGVRHLYNESRSFHLILAAKADNIKIPGALNLAIMEKSANKSVSIANNTQLSEDSLLGIINKYIGAGKSAILDFQNELIEAGHRESATL